MNPLSELQAPDFSSVPSPSLLVWPDRVQANIDRMIDLVRGDVSRLRPHVKTHKMAEVIRMQMEAGVHRFKAATIAEVELCLSCGAPDVLLAYPPVGPNRERLVKLAARFQEAEVHFITDQPATVADLDAQCGAAGVSLGAFIDFDCGMHRTGTGSFDVALQLAQAMDEARHLRFMGIHTYDGHVRDPGPEERESHWSETMKSVNDLVEAIEVNGHPVDSVVGGGSPTFGFHAANRGWQCSPGTTLFWDGCYRSTFPDLPFEPAAAVLTRIVSKPGVNRLCLDLGHKAIASENPIDRRVQLLGLEDAKPVGHSEEHFVLEVEEQDRFAVGEEFIGIPHHICPTVALHQEAVIIRSGEVTGEGWQVAARNRRLSV